MVRDLPTTDLPVKGSDWTVGDTVAHLIVHLRMDTEMVTGGAMSPLVDRESFFTDRRRRSEVNRTLQARCPERGGARLADLLATELQTLLAAVERLPGHHPVRYHFIPMDVAAFTATVLLHTMGHAHDIARTLHRRSAPDPAHARLAIEGMMATAADFLDPDAAGNLRTCIDLRVRGGSRAFIEIDRGHAVVHRSYPSRVACHVSVDPVVFLLVGLGRRSQWPAIARGQLLAWGRNPLVAMRLTKLFPSPG